MNGAGLVDWSVARRVAETVAAVGRIPVGERSRPLYTADQVEAATAEALVTVADYAGLGAVEAPPPVEIVGRGEWAHGALRTLAEASAPLERRLVDDLALPGPLGGIARRAMGGAIGAEAGVAAGYSARRVLGQLDLALFDQERPARLLFVGENLESAREELHADPELFLRWIALHESTHVIQFERVPWLLEHLRNSISTLIEETAEELRAGSLGELGRRLVGDPRQLVAALLRGELMRAVASPEQGELLDRIQATMAVVEGHAEHVMDVCARERDPALDTLRRRLDERRTRRGGFAELLGRLLGIELKLRQYALGKRFFDAIAAQGGAELVRLPWRSEADLPTLAELELPGAWLERVGMASAAA
jgi:coenzyme F420 biosynthesis associated uncharacterized protein